MFTFSLFYFLKVDCTAQSYKVFRGVNAFFVLMYMSLPLAWLVALYRVRDRVNPPLSSSDPGLALWMRDRDPTLGTLRFLYSPYEPRCYYWECLELYRRIFFIGVPA